MAFEKGFGAPISDSFNFFEGVAGVALVALMLVLILAVLNAWKKGRVDVGEVKLRVFRIIGFVIFFGVLLGLWR
tara:strand:- start:5 stop:226 length:222 start_codon:yes stop_codon:yes gene_type:complete